MMVAVIGIAVLVISVIGTALLAGRSVPDQPRQAKVLTIFLYFWVFAFVQLIVVAAGHSIPGK